MTTSPAKVRVLLTALGVRPTRTNYVLNEKRADAEHAPLALLDLLAPDERPEKVFALLTDRARDVCWAEFEAACTQRGAAPSALGIPGGETPEEITETLQTIAANIPDGCELVLDLTHGFRHLPFLFYALCLYVEAFGKAEVVSAWYGKLESEDKDAPKPLIRLDPLLQLPKWLYAVRVFADTGATMPLAAQFDALSARLPEGPERGPPKHAARALRDFSGAYELGLPVELGLVSGRLSHTLEQHPLDQIPSLELPLAAELSSKVLATAQPFRFHEDKLRDGKAKGKWKESVVLDEAELHRQAALIDCYLERSQFGEALALMREWMVSLGVLYRGDPARWLIRGQRIAIERELAALVRLHAKKISLSEDLQFWARLWGALGQRRNHIAHAGMREEAIEMSDGAIRPLREMWDAIKWATQAWDNFGGGAGRLLVSPLGRSPGVLYSALMAGKPDALLVLCSAETKVHASAAIEHVGFAGNATYLEMHDPICGFDEVKPLENAAGTVLLSADEAIVNLTGGTTLMGIVAQRIFEQARDLQRPSRRILLTDRRPQADQLQNPWQASPHRWLDEEDDQGDNA